MDILLTGSVAYDYLMSFPGYFRDHILPDKLELISLSFLVESMVRRRGGIAPNIAYTLALLGLHPRLFATVGEDFEDYRSWLESKGVDTSAVRVIEGEFTASFFANTDLSNAQIASFYPGAMAHAHELSLYELRGDLPDLVVISPNDPGAMVRYVAECLDLGIPYIYDPSQQIPRMENEDLRKGVEHALALFVNDYEFGMIENRTGMSLEQVRKMGRFLAITCGEKGSKLYNQDESIYIPIVQPERIVDPTGVGDAYRGGFLTAFCHGGDLKTCGQMGALAATYCLEQPGPQGHEYTLAEFLARYRLHFEDAEQIERLFSQEY